MDLLEVNTKKVYAELVSKLKERPTAQIRFEEMFPEHNFDWKKIVKLPFQVALDQQTREFQYKLLNRILFTNSKLFKIGLADSPRCTFCGKDNESPEHLFLYCHYANSFRTDISTWLKRCNCNIDLILSDQLDIMFGLFGFDYSFEALIILSCWLNKQFFIGGIKI